MEGQNVRPIPPTYKNGQAWTNRLINSLSAAEIKRLAALYGFSQINKAVQQNAERAIK